MYIVHTHVSEVRMINLLSAVAYMDIIFFVVLGLGIVGGLLVVPRSIPMILDIVGSSYRKVNFLIRSKVGECAAACAAQGLVIVSWPLSPGRTG